MKKRTTVALFGCMGASAVAVGVAVGCSSSSNSSNASNVGPPDPGGTFGAEIGIHVVGGGRVVSAPTGLDCPKGCFYTFLFDPGSQGAKKGVALTAIAGPGWRFSGWTFNQIATKTRGKGAENCQPYTRQTSAGPGGDMAAADVTVLPGETPGTASGGCPGGSVPVAYDATATFVPDLDGGLDGGDDADSGNPDLLYDQPAVGAVGRKIYARTNGRVYWQWDVSNQSAISMGFATGGSRTELVNLGLQLNQFFVYQTVLYQNTTPNYYSQPLTGGTQTLLSSTVNCSAIGGDGSYSYCRSGATIQRWLSTSPTQLASGLPTGTDLWVDPSATGIYFTDTGSGVVYSMPMTGAPDGGTPTTTTVATGQTSPGNVQVWSIYALWINDEGGGTRSLKQTQRTGGLPVTNLITAAGLKDFTVDSSAAYVYYSVVPSAARGASSIQRIPIGGGSPVTVRSGLYNVGGVSVDSSYVYWTDGDGRVYRALRF